MFVVNIKSGFGNQLFQLNFAYYLHKKFPDEKIVCNTTWFRTDAIHGGYMLDKNPFKINNKMVNKIKKIVTDETFDDFIPTGENVFFDGYWQNLKFFEDRLLDYEDIFSNQINENNKIWLSKINSSKTSVSIHVRCGDYNNHFLMGNIATKSYFNHAIDEILKEISEPEFFVFSDDLEWAKNNLDYKGKTVHFITGNEKPEDNKWDIFLMSHCKYNILSNSSFSWWSHYLNKNVEKKAIIPEYWINDIADSFPSVTSSLQNLNTEKSVINFPIILKENTSPLFSIILTAYNQENCLRRAISSVLNQTFQNFELVIVDDCSTDGTIKLIEKYQTLNKNVKLYRHSKNSSSHAARMTGVKNAKGKYILFLDGDDYFFVDALEKLNNEVIEKKDFDVCEFSYVSRPDNEVNTPMPWDDSKPRIEYYKSAKPKVNIWNKLYKTELLKEAFNAMQEGYIRTGDDTYESICISSFTKQYIQSDIKIVNYINEGGISFKQNSYESNLIHAKSLYISLTYLKDFLLQKGTQFEELYNITETHLYNWFVSVIKNNTKEEDVLMSLQLLPQYFSFRFMEPYLKKIYKPYFIKKKVKKIIKKILPQNFKRIIKKILKR